MLITASRASVEAGEVLLLGSASDVDYVVNEEELLVQIKVVDGWDLP
jgi:hypothetical protein